MRHFKNRIHRAIIKKNQGLFFVFPIGKYIWYSLIIPWTIRYKTGIWGKISKIMHSSKCLCNWSNNVPLKNIDYLTKIWVPSMENFLLLVSRIQKKKNPDNIDYCYYHWLPPEKEIRLYCWRHLILETQELEKNGVALIWNLLPEH